MSLFILSPDTVWNASALDFRSAPRKILERMTLWPTAQAGRGLFWRIVFESQILRFSIALSPFVIVMLIWPSMALPVSQAPVLMLIFIGFIEMRVLRVPRHKRKEVTTPDAAAQALDTLNFRGRDLLARIAAKRGLQEGELFLVVDQSDLAGVTPLTLVSVQTSFGQTRLLPLDAEERGWIADTLFDAAFREEDLHKANLRENEFLRSVAFNTGAVTAQARLDALLAQSVPADMSRAQA
ncbi:MAG: hypothetical protein AAF686_07005 [Pseudomonadota bacterium]